VALRLNPVDGAFYDLLSASAAKLVEGADLLAQVLGEEADRTAISATMAELENSCDEITHEIVRRINKTFITPFDRQDIYALAGVLDDVMDHMDKAVDLIMLYRIEHLPSGYGDQVDVLQRCAEITAQAMPGLRSLKGLKSYWIEINRLENAGDKIHRRIVAELFDGSHKAMAVLKLRDIADAIEAAVNSFESVARVIEQIYLKER